MKLLSVAIGIAAGYSAARALEARATGLPLPQAFRLDSILKPVTTVKMLWIAGGQQPSTLAATAPTPADHGQVIDVEAT